MAFCLEVSDGYGPKEVWVLVLLAELCRVRSVAEMYELETAEKGGGCQGNLAR